MQRSILGIVGACGLVFTFNAGAQTAGGAGVSGAGTASSPAVGSAGPAVSQGSIPARAGGNISATPANTANGGNLIGADGRRTSTIAPTPTLPGQAPAANAQGASGVGVNGANTAPIETSPFTPSVAANGNTQSSAAFNALPAAVQSTIAAQLPAGAQVSSVSQEATPQGTIWRAQIMQNGIASEVNLSSVPAIASSFNGVQATTATAGGVPAAGLASAGFVAGTPYVFDQLPVGVQSAFKAQAQNTPVSNISYVAGANGAGTFHGFANGRPIEIRTAGPAQIANSRLTPAATNEVRVEHLPEAVVKAVKETMPYAEITRIRKGESASGSLYDLTLRTDNGLSLMQVTENGTIVKTERNLSLEISSTPAGATNEAPRLNFAGLPMAVRETIEVRADPKEIKLLILTNYLNKATYAVDYLDRDGLRNRLYIGKDGTITRTQTNLFGLAHPGRPVTIDALPAGAQTALQYQTNSVTRIDLEVRGLEPVYVVTYFEAGESRQKVVTREGKVMDAMGAPPSATTGVSPVSIQSAPTPETDRRD